MKVRIIKKHYNYAVDKIVDTNDVIAEKLIRLGVAVNADEPTEETLEEKPKTTKKK
jgi:hypothetical protein